MTLPFRFLKLSRTAVTSAIPALPSGGRYGTVVKS
jgi:hypothetical protein